MSAETITKVIVVIEIRAPFTEAFDAVDSALDSGVFQESINDSLNDLTDGRSRVASIFSTSLNEVRKGGKS